MRNQFPQRVEFQIEFVCLDRIMTIHILNMLLLFSQPSPELMSRKIKSLLQLIYFREQCLYFHFKPVCFTVVYLSSLISFFDELLYLKFLDVD
jgi:hypothetical protein